MAGKRKVWFSNIERQALNIAIGFITAGEWDETLTQRQYDALATARDKIAMDRADAIHNLPSSPSWEEESNCAKCDVVIGDNESGLCLVCSDTAAATSTHPNTARE